MRLAFFTEDYFALLSSAVFRQARGQAMREVQYNKTLLLLQAAAPVALALLSMMTTGSFVAGPNAVLGLIGFAFAALPMFKLLNGRPALRFDDQTLEINTLRRSRSISWTDVRSFDAVRTTTYAYGIIPLKSSMALKFQLAGGWILGRTISLPLKQLDMTEADLPELLSELAGAKGRSYNFEAAATADAQAGDANANAVIARYVAQKQSALRTVKNVSVPATAAPLPVRGARAQFGRRPA